MGVKATVMVLSACLVLAGCTTDTPEATDTQAPPLPTVAAIEEGSLSGIVQHHPGGVNVEVHGGNGGWILFRIDLEPMMTQKLVWNLSLDPRDGLSFALFPMVAGSDRFGGGGSMVVADAPLRFLEYRTTSSRSSGVLDSVYFGFGGTEHWSARANLSFQAADALSLSWSGVNGTQIWEVEKTYGDTPIWGPHEYGMANQGWHVVLIQDEATPFGSASHVAGTYEIDFADDSKAYGAGFGAANVIGRAALPKEVGHFSDEAGKVSVFLKTEENATSFRIFVVGVPVPEAFFPPDVHLGPYCSPKCLLPPQETV